MLGSLLICQLMRTHTRNARARANLRQYYHKTYIRHIESSEIPRA